MKDKKTATENRIYQAFASVYDLFMSDVPYREWAARIDEILSHRGNGLVLDLSCGTGSLTRELSALGYELIGLDSSEDMLMAARAKNPGVLFIQQELTSFELYGTVDAVVSTCDSLNYLLKPQELEKVLKLIRNYLNPGGLFIFDMNTAYKYSGILGDETFSDTYDEAAFICENHFDLKTKVHSYYTTFFISDGQGKFDRFEECHNQYAYSVAEVNNMLTKHGFEVSGMYDGYSTNALTADSERVLFVCRKQ